MVRLITELQELKSLVLNQVLGNGMLARTDPLIMVSLSVDEAKSKVC